MHFIVVVSHLVILAAASYASEKNLEIIGGHTADDGQFPYQISVRVYGEHSCGGSIINSRWALTAAHCVVDVDADLMSIVAGTNSLTFGGVTYDVEKHFPHENFNPDEMSNDIALLKLTKAIVMDDQVQPLELNTAEVGTGEDLVLSGWGKTSYPGNAPDKLQYINLKSITLEECKDEQIPLNVYDSQICTFTTKGEGACKGDSGGPLAYNGKLAGIVSWGRPCADGYPDVFTKVSGFIDWIDGILERNP